MTDQIAYQSNKDVRTRTCLIVDDSQVLRKLARTILERSGFKCQEAADEVQAQNLVRSSMPDLIFLDWHLAASTGIEFMQWLKTQKGHEKAQVLMCSVEDTCSAIEYALAKGADEYIMKPFDQGIVTSKLEHMGLIS